MNKKFAKIKTNAVKIAETEKKFEQHRLEAIKKAEANNCIKAKKA